MILQFLAQHCTELRLKSIQQLQLWHRSFSFKNRKHPHNVTATSPQRTMSCSLQFNWPSDDLTNSTQLQDPEVELEDENRTPLCAHSHHGPEAHLLCVLL